VVLGRKDGMLGGEGRKRKEDGGEKGTGGEKEGKWKGKEGCGRGRFASLALGMDAPVKSHIFS